MRGVAVDHAKGLFDISNTGLQHIVELRQGAIGAHNHFTQCFGQIGHALDQRFTGRIEGVNHIDQTANSDSGAFFDHMAKLFGCSGGGDQHGFALLAQFGGHRCALLLQNIEHCTALVTQLLGGHLALIAQFLGH